MQKIYSALGTEIQPLKFEDKLTGFWIIAMVYHCLYIVAISCEYKEFPEEKKFVRGWNYCCGVVVLKLST